MPTSPRRRRRRFWAGYPYYDLYETADGRYLAIAALEKRFWERLCATTDNEELLEAHRADSERRRERVRETLAETFAGAPVETWERRLERADIPRPRSGPSRPHSRIRRSATGWSTNAPQASGSAVCSDPVTARG